MRWLSKTSPQGHLIRELGFCEGSFSPASHIAYFRAVQSADHATPENRPGIGCQKHLPRGFEICAGLLERCGGIALMFARMRTRIEAAIHSMGRCRADCDAPRDRPDADIAVVDVPAIWPFRISAR